ncbi:hypothetical protein CCACVL1_24683 [Corchorus capsularis]|uniref:Uncharacterized protein n=1 Tax=Corchorus capsularis TaxID=210143 RepID=A0A1R3GNG1_COCAP|nr:hypothetical protein CCACVL1_24683 [Corchorus capsularis]
MVMGRIHAIFPVVTVATDVEAIADMLKVPLDAAGDSTPKAVSITKV